MTPRERFLRAATGKDVDRPPVWFMRQAGRYLPEYRDIRGGTTFEERATNPDLAAELTLQPLKRFPLDAAIIFSDILIPLTGMGRPARFPGGGGPVVDNPIRSAEDIDTLRLPDPARDSPYLLDSLRRVREKVPDHALLGFAGAPFTLAAYLIEGGGSRGFAPTKRLAYNDPDAWHRLMMLCADTAADHLRAQVNAGCDAVQLFDTWAEILSPEDYETLALPYVQRVFQKLADVNAPLIYFARGTPHLLQHLPKVGANVWSVDWRVDLDDVRDVAANDIALQGNLDPTLLFAPPERVRRETTRILDRLGGRSHIFNLGHGVLPETPLEGVEAMVRAVVEWKA